MAADPSPLIKKSWQLVPEDPTALTIEVPEGDGVVFGRSKKFNVKDRSVSRKHIKVIVGNIYESLSKAELVPTGKMKITAIGVNSAAVLHVGDPAEHPLPTGANIELSSGDSLMLLSGRFKFTIKAPDDVAKTDQDSDDVSANFSNPNNSLDARR